MPSTPKGRNEKGKYRNKHGEFKARVRRLVPLEPDSDVLELFAGDGVLYRAVWHAAGRGATCDLEDSCVRLAARERPHWTVLKANADRVLRGGLWLDRPFDVVDIDCYGSPWKFLAAFFCRPRALPPVCHLFLTDNYMINRNLSHEDLVLGFRKPGTTDEYLAAVDRLLEKLVAPAGYRCDRKLYRQDRCVQHLVTLSRAGPSAATGTRG